MNGNRLQKIYIIATCVLAIAAIGSWKVSCQASDTADKATTASEKASAAAENANIIAEKAYNIALQTNLPLITSYYSDIDEYSQNWTEK
ncbi:MAG: hypothetical protein FJ023_04825 [Chloroflexi bacterium]|nr:hypothetical protein [Chloroflexota bacterium]